MEKDVYKSEQSSAIEAPSSSIQAEQSHWARVVACRSSVCGAGGTTNKFRSSAGGSNGQVEYSTEEGGEPKRGRRGRGTRPRTPPSEPKPQPAKADRSEGNVIREGGWRSDGIGGGDFGVELHVTVEFGG